MSLSKTRPPLQVERETNSQWRDGRRTSGDWQGVISAGKVHQCPHCAYNTTDSFKLRRHTLKHTGERPFTCPYCSYGTTRKELLKEHINLHTGEKPYTCSYCPYSASQRSSLNVHLRRHTGDRPYTCTYCPYQSAHKISLKNHMLIHKGKDNWNRIYSMYHTLQRSISFFFFRTRTVCHWILYVKLIKNCTVTISNTHVPSLITIKKTLLRSLKKIRERQIVSED